MNAETTNMANKVHKPGKLLSALLSTEKKNSVLVGSVFRLEEVWSNDTSRVGDSNHTTGRECRGSRSNDCSCSIGDEWNDSGIGTGNHENADISTTHPRNGGEKDISNCDKDQSTDDMLHASALERIHQVGWTYSRSFPLLVGMPRVSDNDEECEDVGRHRQELRFVYVCQCPSPINYLCADLQPLKPRLEMMVGAK
jgi:hypothetical protein